jgi:hypothetical protein
MLSYALIAALAIEVPDAMLPEAEVVVLGRTFIAVGASALLGD